MSLAKDVQSLNPGALWTGYVLEVDYPTPTTYRWHSGLNELKENVVWQGETYEFMPIEADGFEWRGNGSLPRPTLTVSNVMGLMSWIISQTDGLRGAKVIRKRTFVRYLDAVNFSAGNPEADPNTHFPDEIWFVNRVQTETKSLVTLELSSVWDVSGVLLPRRVVVKTCMWEYRGPYCGYTGGPVAKEDDTPTSNPAEDRCGKRLTSCKLRFGSNATLPFGGFPAVAKIYR